jgi:flagellar biosynthesis/type III secretory pathway chaperone
MTQLFEQLDKIVEQKTVLYGQFIDLLGEEWRRIAEDSLEKLELILERKASLMMTIENLNMQREQTVAQIAVLYGLDSNALTLKEIIRLQGNPQKHRLAHHRRVLRGQIDTINRMNQANRKLVRQSSQAVKKSIDYLTQPKAQPTPYSSQGNLDEAPMEGRMVSTSA